MGKITIEERIAALETKVQTVINNQEATQIVLEKIHNLLFEKNGGKESIVFSVADNSKEIREIKRWIKNQKKRRYDASMLIFSSALGFLSALLSALIVLYLNKIILN
ncbi:MAG: hypothetical protein GXO75_08230 [Calditrichaeota bacterium]|nr:hypothetical protein [Calditrichota bacterium]